AHPFRGNDDGQPREAQPCGDGNKGGHPNNLTRPRTLLRTLDQTRRGGAAVRAATAHTIRGQTGHGLFPDRAWSCMNSTFDPLVGQVLDDRYEIVAKIARGGMATVYRARDLRLSRVVAVKVMRSD